MKEIPKISRFKNFFKFLIFLLVIFPILIIALKKGFLLFLIYTILIIFIFKFKKRIKRNYLRSIFRNLLVVLLGLLSFDVFFLFKKLISNESEIIRERIGPQDYQLRKFSKDFPSGYLLKNGNFFVTEFIWGKDGKKIYLYKDINYRINNNVRGDINLKDENYCPDVILLGGSHNFGQGLNIEQTIDGMLRKDGNKVLNLSIPGFGLANSASLLYKGFFKDYLFQNCNNSKPKFLIYRHIANHILRDSGKTSLNIYGPNYGNFKSDKLRSYCDNIFSCAKYLGNYSIARINIYLKLSYYERSATLFAKIISYFHEFNNYDFRITDFLIKDTLKNANNLGIDNVIFIIDKETDQFLQTINKKYENLLKNYPSIKVITHDSFNKEYNCEDLENKDDYIKNEGHPTHCLNKKVYKVLNNYFINYRSL